MIRHALLMRFPEGDAAARNAALGSLIALGDHLGHVSSFACGPDLVDELAPGARAEGFTHAFAVVFETQAARAAYRALPAYAEASARLARAVEGADGVRILE